MLMKRTFAILALAVLAFATAAAAQQCLAMASFRGQPYQAYGSGNFTDNTTFVGAGFGYGGTNAFGQAQLGSMNHDQYNASALTLGVGGGYDVATDDAGRWHLCPMANVAYQTGPDNINGSGVNYRETDFALGASMGYLAAASRQVEVMPMASLSVANASTRRHFPNGTSSTTSDAYGVLGLGLGIIVNRQVSFRPALNLPFDGGTTSFSVAMGVNWGR
jgi:hypothetical protein